MGWRIISPGAVHSRRVPSLGGYVQTHDHTTILLIGCFSGVLFTGIHCVGWNFLFTSHAEQILWRTASLATLGALMSISISAGYDILRQHWKSLPSINQSLDIVIIMTYLAARLTLIVLILLSFRSLPPDVYVTVAWTKLIPHF